MRQYSTLSLLLGVTYIAVAVTLLQWVLRYMETYSVGAFLLYPGPIGLLAIASILMSAAAAVLSPRSSMGWYWLNLAHK